MSTQTYIHNQSNGGGAVPRDGQGVANKTHRIQQYECVCVCMSFATQGNPVVDGAWMLVILPSVRIILVTPSLLLLLLLKERVLLLVPCASH